MSNVNTQFHFDPQHIFLKLQRGESDDVDNYGDLQSNLLELLNNDTLDQLGALHLKYQDIKVSISGNY